MKILLAIDGSPYSKKMLAYLCAHDELINAGRNTFTALTVLPAIPPRARLEAVGSLASLRREAGLPARIRASGLQCSKLWLERWRAAGYCVRALGNTGVEVNVPDGLKLELLRQLLGEANPGDIEIQQPSLEDLYRFYMERAGDVRAEEGRT